MQASPILGRRRRQLELHPSLSTMGCVVVLPSLAEPLWVRTLSYPSQSACPTCLPSPTCPVTLTKFVRYSRCHWTKTICHSEREINHSKEKKQGRTAQDKPSIHECPPQRGCPDPPRRAGPPGAYVDTRIARHAYPVVVREGGHWPTGGCTGDCQRPRRAEGDCPRRRQPVPARRRLGHHCWTGHHTQVLSSCFPDRTRGLLRISHTGNIGNIYKFRRSSLLVCPTEGTFPEEHHPGDYSSLCRGETGRGEAL